MIFLGVFEIKLLVSLTPLHLFPDVTALTSYWQNEYHHLDRHTGVDDTFLSFYLSFMHLTTTRLAADTTGQCQVVPSKVLQVHLFQRGDRNQGLLVLFETTSKEGTRLVLESHMMLRQHYSVINPTGPAGRLINLEVITKYIVHTCNSVVLVKHECSSSQMKIYLYW